MKTRSKNGPESHNSGPGSEIVNLGRFEGFRKGILKGKSGTVNLSKSGPPGTPQSWAWEEEKTITKRSGRSKTNDKKTIQTKKTLGLK